MKFSIEKRTLCGFSIASVVLISINALSHWSFSKHRETAAWVAHTYQVRQNLESTLADLEEAETEQRGYLITGEESYLKLYYNSIASINQQVKKLQTLTADNSNQQQRIDILKPLVTRRLTALDQVIKLRREQGFEAARIGVKTSQGTVIMTRIRQLLQVMDNEEATLLKQRVRRQEIADMTQNLVFSIGIVFNLLVFYWLYHAIRREITQRQQAQAALENVNQQLELRVQERTIALEETNQSLCEKFTALQQAKTKLRDNYNLLRTVIDASPHPIFVKDLQGRYQLMNIVGASRFNKRPEELIGLDSSALFPPEVYAKFQADDQRVLTLGQAETVEETVPINSELRTYLTTQNVYRDSEGNIQGIVGFARDITHHKQAQEELRRVNEELEQRVHHRTAALEKVNAALAESEAMLRLFIENVPNAIAMFDREMRYLAVSQRWITDYNLDEQNIIGRSHYDVFPEIPDCWKEDHQNVLAGAIIKTEEDCFMRADSTIDWLRYELYPWRNIVGEVSGLIMFTEVITERRKAEQNLKQLNAELLRSNTELEQFAYVASHDLREPLRKIKSYTELLAEDYQGQLDASADKYIAYITDGATRMQALISDLLTYSRVGKGEFTKEPTDLEAVVRRTLKDLSLTIRENKAWVTIKPLPTVVVNSQQMMQLFQNLIANALKFRSEANPAILIEAELKDSEWLIRVQDNGLGIKPQYVERIFVIFQRLHSRDKYPGTGIGLAICRKIVERHGGRIWVESVEGQGATFYFTLPA